MLHAICSTWPDWSRSTASAPETLVILRRVRGYGPVKHQYEDRFRPTDGEWQAELGHQTKGLGDPQDALETVRSTLVELMAW